MLSKRVCKACRLMHLNNTLWTEKSDAAWEDGYVYCPVGKTGTGIMTPIYMAEDDCRYKLEHVVSQEEPC